MNEYKEFFPNCRTSRNESRTTDDRGVDLCFTGDINVQAKCFIKYSLTDWIKELNRMPKWINILHVKQTNPWCRGELVIMSKDQRFNMLRTNGIPRMNDSSVCILQDIPWQT